MKPITFRASEHYGSNTICAYTLQRVEPLLCNDREISKYTRAVSKQRLDKHVLATTDTHAAIQALLETVFSTQSVQRGYKEEN
jgi:hypothetical protein